MIKEYPKFFLIAIILISTIACTPNNTSDEIIDLRTFKNEWVVINFWASWCKPCVHEIPELNKLNSLMPNINVVGVNYDELVGEELSHEAARLGIKFPNLTSDPSIILKTSRPIVLPTTLLLDRDLKLHATLVGPQTFKSLTTVIAETRTNLGEQSPNLD